MADRTAALLDIDGTLVDSNYFHALAWFRAFRAQGRFADDTPSGRLLFWLRSSFVADAALGLIAGLLIAEEEPAGWYLLAFAALVGLVALLGLCLAGGS